MPSKQLVSFTEAIRLATEDAMTFDSRVHVFGLGVSYPNGADGTMGDLGARYPDRVRDTPCSEAAVTSMAIGAAVSGLRPIVHHGRVEFAFYASDAILTQASNWSYMFGGEYPCPIVFRIALGRQWGNGPQHTRVPRGMFAIPGLKVVCPSTPAAAEALLLAAVQDSNPVVYLEQRWLYKTRGSLAPAGLQRRMALNEARFLVRSESATITIVAVGEMVLEALRAARFLKEIGVRVDVIDLVSVYPIDFTPIVESLQTTKRLVVADSAPRPFGVYGEILSGVLPWAEHYHSVSAIDAPCPTATSLTAGYYPDWRHIVHACQLLRFEIPSKFPAPSFEALNLAPTDSFDDLIPEGADGNVH